MKLLVASKNKKKLFELKQILGDLLNKTGEPLFELVSLSDYPGIGEIEEDGKTFEENAVKKALGYASGTHLLTLADDSGLSIEALKGEPGVHSARFAGPGKNDVDNCDKVLKLMENIPDSKRSGKFQCVIAIAKPGKLIGTAHGEVQGMILRELRGKGGFGYDPLFYYPPFKKTLAEVPPEQKNAVSHRSQALKRAKIILSQLFK